MIDAKSNINKIVGIIDKTINTYEENLEKIKYLEGLSNDIMHEISLGKKRGVVEGYKLYEEYRQVLLERYAVRDEAELLKPMYDYLKPMIGMKSELGKVLTKTINKEKYLSDRVYKPRAKEEMELTMKTELGNPFEQALKGVL